MNLYEKFIAKQNEIIDCINKKDDLEAELSQIKREIFKKHKSRFDKKPIGKTTLSDDGFDIVYERKEKITLLTELVKQDDFESDCIVEKVVPEKKTISFSKSEFKKLSDEKQEEVEKYIAREKGAASLKVTKKED